MPADNPLTAAELRVRYGVATQTIDNWRRLGKIAPVSGKRKNRYGPLRYDPTDIERLLGPYLAALRARLDSAQPTS